MTAKAPSHAEQAEPPSSINRRKTGAETDAHDRGGPAVSSAGSALLPRGVVALGRYLRDSGYGFTPVTPTTQVRVLERFDEAETLRDIFGWSAPFRAVRFPEVWSLLQRAGALEPLRKARGSEPPGFGTQHVPPAGLFKSRVRFASFGRGLYAHSAFPTLGHDSVFFGPDSLRFLRSLQRLPPPYGRLIDVGTGSGVGGLWLAPHAREVVLSDLSSTALAFASINMELNGAGTHVSTARSDLFRDVSGPFDTIIANPPFLLDQEGRAYRHGGGGTGTDLAVALASRALERLAPLGRLVIYSGAPIAQGVDLLRERLEALDRSNVSSWRYEEIDPDIFGEQLDEPGYERVERIAAVVLSVRAA